MDPHDWFPPEGNKPLSDYSTREHLTAFVLALIATAAFADGVGWVFNWAVGG